jgi:hypothetical protein
VGDFFFIEIVKIEIPLLLSIPYLIDKTELNSILRECAIHNFCFKADRSAIGRPASMIVSGGEFDWGGTSVKL